MKKLKEDNDKLIAVRCSPDTAMIKPGSYHWLHGCLGEVKSSDLNRAYRNKTSGKGKTSVNVRFPVAGFFQNIGRYPNWKMDDSFCTLSMPLGEIIETGEIPVSNYNRAPLHSSTNLLDSIINRNCEEGYYISSHSKDVLNLPDIKARMDKMKYRYVWKLERGEGKSYCLLETRIYPLNVLISPCPREIKGFVLSVYSRPLEDYYSERMLEDVYIFSDNPDSIDCLDGDIIGRQRLEKGMLDKYCKDLSIVDSLEKMKKGIFNPQLKKEEE